MLLWLLLIVCRLDAQEPAAWPTEGTLFEPITEVLVEKIVEETPRDGVLSIPYTRVDVAVDDGVAITRLLQVYHNHGEESIGYGFSLPLQPDTTISQFHLWDQGKRLVGSITERRRAEKVYEQVTGDEAPEMRRDPGLVRRTENRFDMRMFPIVPGEDKQMELFTHQRLTMQGGDFVLLLPLSRLTRSQDPQHPGVSSRRVEVSIYVKDTLPILRLTSSPLTLVEVRREPHRMLLRLDLENREVPDLEIRFSLDLGGRQHVATTRTFDGGDGERFFSTRILTPEVIPEEGGGPTANASPPSLEGSEPPSFYLGVWRSRQTTLEQDAGSLTLEAAAFLTAVTLPVDAPLHGSWRAPRLREVPASWFAGGMTTDRPIVLKEGLEEMVALVGELESKVARPAPSPSELVEHLERALSETHCQRVLLFLDTDFPETDWERIAALLEAFPGVSFTLVTDEPWDRASGLGLPQVEHFALRGGWQSHHTDSLRRILETDGWHELGFLDLDFTSLAELWEGLGWAGERLPAVRWRGDLDVIEPELFPGRRAPEKGHHGAVWLSGRYRGGGPVELEVDLPNGGTGVEGLFMPSSALPVSQRLQVTTTFPEGDPNSRFVASLWARPRAERLSARLAMLRQLDRTGGVDSGGRDLGAEMREVRRQVVELSRRYSFISSETAFIALPEDLRRDHRLRDQHLDAQQLYNLEGMKSGGLPEPEEWAMLLLGLLLVGSLLWRSSRQRWLA